jgi:hypothetical protein
MHYKRILGEMTDCVTSMRWRKAKELAVLAMFKNEADVLDEWVRHYANQGATAIHLINNNSDDNYLAALSQHLNSGLVILHHDTRLHAQKTIYNEHLKRLRPQCHWLVVCDLDEFIYARYPYQRCIDYLRQLPPWVSSVQLPWKMFGSSGHVQQPSLGVRAGFIYRANTDASKCQHPCMQKNGTIQGKSIVRCSRTRSLEIHRVNLLWGSRVLPDGSKANADEFQPISERRLADSKIHLNHYAIQSVERFQRIKMQRGDVNSKDFEEARTMNYFSSYDHNEYLDDELANQTLS